MSPRPRPASMSQPVLFDYLRAPASLDPWTNETVEKFNLDHESDQIPLGIILKLKEIVSTQQVHPTQMKRVQSQAYPYRR